MASTCTMNIVNIKLRHNVVTMRDFECVYGDFVNVSPFKRLSDRSKSFHIVLVFILIDASRTVMKKFSVTKCKHM